MRREGSGEEGGVRVGKSEGGSRAGGSWAGDSAGGQDAPTHRRVRNE